MTWSWFWRMATGASAPGDGGKAQRLRLRHPLQNLPARLSWRATNFSWMVSHSASTASTTTQVPRRGPCSGRTMILQDGADLAQMQSMGLNTVRIFVPFTDFGGDEGEPPAAREGCSTSSTRPKPGIRVLVTLFDHRTDHAVANWAADDQHLAQVCSCLCLASGITGLGYQE